MKTKNKINAQKLRLTIYSRQKREGRTFTGVAKLSREKNNLTNDVSSYEKRGRSRSVTQNSQSFTEEQPFKTYREELSESPLIQLKLFERKSVSRDGKVMSGGMVERELFNGLGKQKYDEFQPGMRTRRQARKPSIEETGFERQDDFGPKKRVCKVLIPFCFIIKLKLSLERHKGLVVSVIAILKKSRDRLPTQRDTTKMRQNARLSINTVIEG